MEILRDVKIDWLGHRWKFIGLSGAVALLTVILYFVRGGFTFGIDFTGGTVAYIKFQEAPDFKKVRSALEAKLPGTPLIQTFGKRTDNTVQVKMEQFAQGERSIGRQARLIREALHAAFNPGLDAGGKRDLNESELGVDVLSSQLISLDPLNVKAVKTLAEQTAIYQGLATKILDIRKEKGIISNIPDLRKAEGMTDAGVEKLKTQYYAGNFAIQGVQSIGGVVGKDLRDRAQNAIGLSLLGMLVYIAFRFKRWSYGIGAVVSLLHDVIVVLGAFLLFNKEISLTVIASILTIVGYSVNDTIVIFDRVRDNLKLLRRESFSDVMNLSINQTLGRTVLTTGFTFLTVLSIYTFGGEVLDGFAFALVIGMITGAYSTVAIAGPIVLLWHNFFEKRAEASRT
jgi:preprotein translocase subunit SecF